MTKPTIVVNIEYFALRTLCAVVNALPYPVVMAMARGTGRLMFSVLRFKRHRTVERIRGVFPEKSEREVAAIAVQSIQNVLQTAVEMMRAPKLDRKWMDKHILDGQFYKDKLQSYVDEGKGVVIMVPHSGNWYMAAWSMAKYGLPLFAIAARQRNPKIDAWMKRQYGDIEVLDRNDHSTLGLIREKLSAGRAFAILSDLRVHRRDVEVDFFGRKANVSRSGAAFAVRCGCPIVVAIMSRNHGKHIFNHLATLRPDPNAADKKEEARRLTREVMTLLSNAIMQSPGDWYWYNKRWILQPVKEDL